MITKGTYEKAKKMALELFQKSSIPISEKEATNIEIVDFGLDNLFYIGLQLITYINTSRVCAKEMVLLSNQICPEHMHPSLNGQAGKEETFRCRYGTVYLYVDGTPNEELSENFSKKEYSGFHKITLRPGDQYTIYPDTKHWFQGGDCGAIISEFSTHSNDNTDIFTNPLIIRDPIYN